MHKDIFTFFLLFISFSTFTQITGKIVDNSNNPLPYVNIYLKNVLSGTISNDGGHYELKLHKKGQHTLIFQFLGFKTLEKKVTIHSFPFQLNVVMFTEDVLLKEIEISATENLADVIIKKVITNKEKNTNKSGKYTADFYSRGLFKVENAPKKILGQKIGELGGGLDSTRSGIVYLSETISEIKYQKKPKKFNEVIIASKVSGESNGIAFNSADEVNFNLYLNQITIVDEKIFSPIANYAFNYYTYKLEGTFPDKNGKLIYKIQVIPKRENDRVFKGYIYIVKNDWAVYGADLTITGTQINFPAIDLLHIKQDYNYDEKAQTWALILQTIDFKVAFLKFKLNGRFSASYANYNFDPVFTKKTFTKEVLSFKEGAIRKDSDYWNSIRPVPLTLEEEKDYIRKDSISTLLNSKVYLDSVDAVDNKFKPLSALFKYQFKNSHKKWRLKYDGPLLKTRFNSVQGFNTSFDLQYFKKNNEIGNNWNIDTYINYGFSDKILRPVISFTKNWNQFKRPQLHIEAGNKTSQFDDKNPIPSMPNTMRSLLFKDSFAKYYDKTFAQINYSTEITNGFRFFSSLEYADRKPLVNTTNYNVFNRAWDFEPNIPTNATISATPFKQHQVVSAKVGMKINFGSKYITYPDRKHTIYNKNNPTLNVEYRKNFGSNGAVNSDFIYTKLHQTINFASLGEFAYNAKAGTFFKEKNIPFIDYYHPLANEIVLAPKKPLSSFNLLPYYQLSTNSSFAEIHTQQHFKGFLLNKIPLISKLNFQLVMNAKSYFSSNNKPYTEFGIGLDNIGLGKFRFLRVDYVQSYHNGNKQNGFVIGVNLF